ncbi:MAG: alpha/beta fold hydrolase [Pirellulales bacterium]|nr:alpha/beta fold hydrolase [Pirellulales bacterium]
MQVDLVHITTADGLRLAGALQVPPPISDAAPPTRPALDAIVCVHGTGSNFYASTLMETIAARLVELGIAALRVNTRGHDGISTTSGRTGPVRGGAAYERVADCRFDLAAWVALLVERGYERVGLLGHSLGGLKCIYALAQSANDDRQNSNDRSPLDDVRALVAISPPRLSHSVFRASAHGTEFSAAFDAAQALVDAGRGDTLIESTFPLPYVVSAAGYVDKYGPHERYQILHLLAGVSLPTLILYGSEEVARNIAFAGVPEAIEALPPPHDHRQVGVIAGGDHFYAGVRSELLGRLERWLRRLSLP